MSQNGKLKPNLDEKGTKLLNLTVLQRIDPFVEEILITAAHVAFYAFDIDTSQWSRREVEGSLFVVKRNTQPRFQFIVMNRRNTDNLVENLLEDFEYEVQVPYLLYKNATEEVNGIWFYNAPECEEVANLFSRILNAYAKVPTKSKTSVSRSEFEESEATMTATDSTLQQSSTSSNTVSDAHDDRAFVNFFSSALNLGNAPNLPISGQTPYQSPATVLTVQPGANIGADSSVAMPYQPPAAVGVALSSLPATVSASGIKHPTDLVKPSAFFASSPMNTSSLIMPPMTTSLPTAPPLNTNGNLQRPYGAPLLQPFPPPSPPPSLTPVATANYAPIISREKIRDALQMLVQDKRFIDIVYEAMVNAQKQ